MTTNMTLDTFYTAPERTLKLRRESESNRQALTLAVALSTMSLSACGGGGGSSSGTAVPSSSNTSQNSSNPTTSSAPTSNALTLVPSGQNYITTTVTGFSQVNSLAHYAVADAADNEYDIVFSASGSGMLTFEFDDEKDTVSMESGSVISGFTDLKVINGTVDASNADMGSIANVSVASSVKLTAAQVLSLDAIVINAESGSVDVLVSTDEEIEQLSAAVSSGALKLFSPVDDLLQVQAAPGAAVSAEKISESKATMNATKRPVAEAEELGIAQAPETPDTTSTATAAPVFVALPPVVNSSSSSASPSSDTAVVQGSAAITVSGAEDGLTTEELVDPISINILPETGSSIISVEVDGVSAQNIVGNLYQFDGSALTGGYHNVSVLTEATNGVQALTEAQVWVVGSSNLGKDMFDLRASQSGDVVNVDAYVKNLHSEISDGIKTADIVIDLDPSQLDYVEGSFKFADSAIAPSAAENTSIGEIVANGIFLDGWSNYGDAFFSFSARLTGELTSAVVSIPTLTIWDTELGDFSVPLVI